MQTRGLMQAGSPPVPFMAVGALWLSGAVTLAVLLESPVPVFALPAAFLILFYAYAHFTRDEADSTPHAAAASLNDDAGTPGAELAEHFVAKEFAAARRGRDVTLVMFGFSRFEEFTEREGTGAAAVALREFGRVLQQMTRQMNLSARYGWRADAFLSVLSDANPTAAEGFIARVRDAVTRLRVPIPAIEVGVAVYQPHLASPEEFVDCALQALEAARAANGVSDAAHGNVPTITSPVRSVTGRRAARSGRAKTA